MFLKLQSCYSIGISIAKSQQLDLGKGRRGEEIQIIFYFYKDLISLKKKLI